MLKKLRNKKLAKKVWIVLLVLILPAFVLWGLGSVIRSSGDSDYAGTIFGKKVTLREYKDAIMAQNNILILRFGTNFPEIKKQLNLEQAAWERIILLAEAKRRKIKVSDEEVVETIRNYPFFQHNGVFQEKIYSDSLRYVFRTQPRVFEEQIRQNIILAGLAEQLTSAITLTDEEIKKEYRKLNQELSIYYIAALPASFIKETSPSDEELKEYFEKSQIEFKRPLSFNLEYIVLDSETTTKNIALRLKKKEDFAKIAKEAGLSIKETGLFSQTDSIPEIGWHPQIMESVSRLKVGQFLPAIQVDKQYFIVRLKDRKESYIPAFETVKEKVREVYTKAKSYQIAKEKIQGCLTKLKELQRTNPRAVDFNRLSSEFGLKYGWTAPFVFGTYIEGIGASDEFWLKAQGLKEGDASEILTTPSGFYIIRLKSKSTLDEKKLEEEKATFAKKILLQKKSETFAHFLEELVKKCRR